MNKINIGLIGYGVVGQGFCKLIRTKRSYIKKRFGVELNLKTLCDRSIANKDTSQLGKTQQTTDYKAIIEDKEIDVVVELIGGMKPAKEIVQASLKSGKHVITANKELIANCGIELFQLAKQYKKHLYFESSVGAGIPIIKYLTEGIVGNQFNSLFGIINGTCNFILDEMTHKGLSFDDALKDAQAKGYAESDPTLDINGMDSTHKLAILTFLAFGKMVPIKEIYTEGISHLSHDDIEQAEKLNLCIKLLAIAKKVDNELEVRVHPTLIPKDHPLASINSVYNAVYINSDLMGDSLLSGEGAGQMAAASGVFSDLINLTSKGSENTLHSNIDLEDPNVTLRKIDQIESKFYLRIMASDKPGVLSQITSILGDAGIGINSVTQNLHNKQSHVPVIMVTDYTCEKILRTALEKIHQLPVIKSKPIAIRMERLP